MSVWWKSHPVKHGVANLSGSINKTVQSVIAMTLNEEIGICENAKDSPNRSPDCRSDMIVRLPRKSS